MPAAEPVVADRPHPGRKRGKHAPRIAPHQWQHVLGDQRRTYGVYGELRRHGLGIDRPPTLLRHGQVRPVQHSGCDDHQIERPIFRNHLRGLGDRALVGQVETKGDGLRPGGDWRVASTGVKCLDAARALQLRQDRSANSAACPKNGGTQTNHALRHSSQAAMARARAISWLMMGSG